MKAIVYSRYGSPDVLRLSDIEKPVAAADEVVVKVCAAAVNPLDWHLMRGTPWIMRPGLGLRKPRGGRLGADFAGVIETVGANVKRFRPGDTVFGGRPGAFAEYISVPVDRALAPKPANLSFEQAASVPIAGVTALQALRDKGNVQAGQKVLINGAA
ncbi:MAG: NAD(P)-dependent alcohol dehydrogenase, partial [Gammaproteobacteria bacterium]